jgi:hypothetical protein
MGAEPAHEVVDAFDALVSLVSHCLGCHRCRKAPDQMCLAARPLHDSWKAAWKRGRHGDLRTM